MCMTETEQRCNPCICNHSTVVVLKTGMYGGEMRQQIRLVFHLLLRTVKPFNNKNITCMAILTPHSILFLFTTVCSCN